MSVPWILSQTINCMVYLPTNLANLFTVMVNIGKYTDRIDPNGLFLWHQLVYICT